MGVYIMNYKLSRNLWIISGVLFFITSIINIFSKRTFALILLDIVVVILSFINAYIQHKKIYQNKDKE